MSQNEALLMDTLDESFKTLILMTDKLINLERRLLSGDPVSLIAITKDIQDNQETVHRIQGLQKRLAFLNKKR